MKYKYITEEDKAVDKVFSLFKKNNFRMESIFSHETMLELNINVILY